jgi:hypothetical protein
MNNNKELATKPFSPEDNALLRKLKEKAWITFLRLYLPISLFIVWIYYRMQPGGTFRGHTLKYGRQEFNIAYTGFAVFFGGVFLFFMTKDFRRLILPFQKEVKLGKKYCLVFPAKKYQDILYGKCLLFYPDKDNLYIEVAKEDFEAIGNGEELYLETACITGEVLTVKSASRVFKSPAEFSFSDR